MPSALYTSRARSASYNISIAHYQQRALTSTHWMPLMISGSLVRLLIQKISFPVEQSPYIFGPWKTSYDLQHTSGSWYPPIDLWFKRVSTLSQSQRRTTHVRYPFTFITRLSVRRRSFPVTCCALIELTLSRHCSVYGKHNSTESIAL
jgi:hypothetical protein